MVRGRISFIIPARNELFLKNTIEDILNKMHGDIEVIAVLDGYWCDPSEIVQDKRVTYLHQGIKRGMRESINHGAAIATGEYLFKSDAHCMFAEGLDLELKAGIPEYSDRIENGSESDNWIVIPRRKRLDAEKWEVQVLERYKPDIDYEFLNSPASSGAKGQIWTERIMERLGNHKYDIDENMTFQGSGWFMTRNHYLNRLGGMSEVGYTTFVREAQEIGLKTWLGGGKIYINKKTWYAHLHKGHKYGRMYFLNKIDMIKGEEYCDDFWFNNRWKEAKYDMAWFIERFMPVPTWDSGLIESVRKHRSN